MGKDCGEFRGGRNYLEECMAGNTEMNRWREEECPSPADTYIEWRFEYKCIQLKGGFDIITEWRMRKRYYISVLQTISIDFPHFSRHDDSHSVNILVAIEMLLGKERIDQLSAGDLWMLLECAYAHDIGMALSYDELEEMWKTDDKFREHIASALAEGSNHPNYNAANYYKQIDNLLRGKRRGEGLKKPVNLEELFPQTWPLEFSQGIAMLIADYVRNKHAERIWSAWERRDKNSDPVIPKRLDRAVQTACELHGRTFREIKERLSYCCKGFGNEKIHPRFAAAMLAIGDVLDLDNNRFNPRAVERVGRMPYVSMLHRKKHEAVTHFAIRTSGIQVEAVSKEPDVCKVLSQWFYWLEEGTKELICTWNEIVPSELQGCLLNPSQCTIYLESEDGKKRNRFTSKLEKEFNVDKTKLIKLLSGNSIYASKVDFIREYLQNALDATKMQLWQDLKNGQYEYSEGLNHDKNFDELCPFDIDQDIYKKYEIQVWIKVDVKRQKVRLKFVDFGIGMEKECIDVLANIGIGWRGRKKYSGDITKMPQWLRPTGGFGIGVQSAFMVTDKIVITTKDEESGEGRKLTLSSPKVMGTVSEEHIIPFRRGTTVEIELDMFHFYESQHKYAHSAYLEQKEGKNRGFAKLGQKIENVDFFDQKQAQEQIEDFLQKYIEVMLPNAFFPIRLVRDVASSRHNVLVENRFWPSKCYWNQTDQANFHVGNCEWRGNQYLYIVFADVDQNRMQVTIWNFTKNICFYFICRGEQVEREMRICFKNVLVKEETTADYLQAGRRGVLIDILGSHAEDILKVHRDKLDEVFQKNLNKEYFINAYLLLFHVIDEALNEEKFKSIRYWYSENVSQALFRLVYLKEQLEPKMIHLTDPDSPMPGAYRLDEIKPEELVAFVGNGELLKEKLPMLTYREFIERIASFVSDDNASFLLCKGEITDVKCRISIPTSKMKKQEENDAEELETEPAALNEFLYYLQSTERMIIYGTYASILAKMSGVECENYRFDDGRTVYAKISKKQDDIEPENEEKMLFYSYTYGSRDERYCARITEESNFAELSVDELPFKFKIPADNTDGTSLYLISPIGNNAYSAIHMKEMLTGGDISFDMFRDCITEQDDFEALIEYVYKRRCEGCLSVNRDDIRNGYINYIHQIYKEGYKSTSIK